MEFPSTAISGGRRAQGGGGGRHCCRRSRQSALSRSWKTQKIFFFGTAETLMEPGARVRFTIPSLSPPARHDGGGGNLGQTASFEASGRNFWMAKSFRFFFGTGDTSIAICFSNAGI